MLSAAAEVRSRSNDAVVLAVYLQPAVEPGFMPTEEIMTPERTQLFEAEQDAISSELRNIFADWQASTDAASWASWREIKGQPNESLETLAAGISLAVLAHPALDERAETGHLVRQLLSPLQRPVLLAPARTGSIGSRIAVAWKPSEAADRALIAALPLMQAAEQIIVLIGPDEMADTAPIEKLLPAAGRIVFERVEADDDTIGHTLLDMATSRGADLLVLGAYTHNRFVEALIGGVTQDMMEQAKIALLMSS